MKNKVYKNGIFVLLLLLLIPYMTGCQLGNGIGGCLLSYGTTVDRTEDIETLLLTQGVCRLGPGDFYVSGIDMPAGTTLMGSGKDTRIILRGEQSEEGYAIHLNDCCTVENMMILGSTTELDCSEYKYVERHGILFNASYDKDESTTRRCRVSNCECRNFSGGGVSCQNTGYPVDSTLMVTDTYINHCMVGINIPYYSEYNTFTSCICNNCYYGSINNGGNNVFCTCDFSANVLGMLIDNSEGQSPNNTHGTVVGCLFNHEDGNEGVGIKIIGCHNGEVFSDCQLFFADIELLNCSGVQFNNFNSGRQVDISVKKGENGGLITFNNWVFNDEEYTIDIEEGYDACKFENCWQKDGKAVQL